MLKFGKTNQQTWQKQYFPHYSDIIGTNLLTKFHEDRKINVASSHIRKNAPPPGSHVFQPTGIIFELFKDITCIGMNLLTKFHEDWTVNVVSRVLTRFYYKWTINAASRVLTSHFQPTGIISELVQNIIGKNLLTKFHEDLTINVASRVLTRFYYSHIKKNAPPLGSHVFQANVTIFELIQDINKTNLLTIFYEDSTINVSSKVLKRKNAPPPGGYVFKDIKTIFKLIQDIIGTNLLTKFHEDRKINVASRVLTRKNSLPPGGLVYQPKGLCCELVQDIIGTNLRTKKNALHLGSHFHEDWAINVASREKCPPLGSHVFQAKITIFELLQDIIGTNLLSKFHEDQKINVATREKWPPPGGHVF
ncbi:hypothetical protein DPMN_042018 [Dreissena polymorpha]|uniref:Uncharacterized protein n=1 Tax=Dreissena polymorpha TaxID=45954 RepID=A0A9D4D099_DREPO|nr:hypothetical protein DPMN_042018 [Dreissena polymorpha]